MSPGKIVLAGCALFVACGLAETALQQSSLLAVLVAGVVAELGGGKLGVAWNDPLLDLPTARQNVQRAGIGLAIGIAVGLLGLGLGLATRAVQHEAHGRPLVVPLALGLLEAFFAALQVELLQRGVLRVFCMKVEPRAFVPAAAVLGTLAAAGRTTSPAALATAAAFSFALALVWERTRAALVPVFLHTGVRFVLLVLAGGSGLGFVGTGPIAGTPLTSGLALGAAALALAGAVRLGLFAPRPPATV